jgi:uncharacterized repeat protein (TIGR01451 family)
MTWNRTTTARGRLIAARLALVVGACAFVFSGCQNFQLPRIDPSGERIFLPPGAPAPISPYANTPYGTTPPYNPAIAPNQTPLPGTTVIAPPVLSAPSTPAPSALPSGVSSPMITSPLQTPPPVLAPATPPPVAPTTSVPMMAPGLPAMPLATAPGMAAPALPSGCSQLGVNLNPSRVVAPVGSEVVMVASLCGGEGYMITGERVEWMIGREGVGQFVSPGERGPFELWNQLRSLPRKVDNLYALNTTASQYTRLDRGTQVPFDDVEIQPGQAWVTVTSPAEGTTNITAFAPNVPEWDRRQQTATIYWVDAQWNFPPPAINPVGTRHTFVTSVSRQSDGSPIEGYLVRYEIVGGPDAAFAPDGNKAIEIPTNELGQASAEIYQIEPRAGTNQVNVQVIRPANANDGGRRFVLGAGSTLKSWTSSDIGVRVIGPPQAAVGNTISYRIEVTNPSGATAKNVVVTDAAPRNLTFVNSTPRGDSSPSGQEWRIGDVGPGQLKTVDAVYQVAQPGNFNYCASVTAEGGLAAKDCMTTIAAGPVAGPAASPSPLSIRVNGPQSAQVGSTVKYEIEVVNTGTTAATGLIVTDTFDAGLEHAVSASPIERDLKDLQPGQSQKFNVSFRVTRAGQLCQQVEVRGAGNVQSSTRSCLTAMGATTPTPFDSGSGSVTEPDRPQRELDTTPPAEGGSVGARFTVRKTGSTRSRVGEEIVFTIEVTNTGDVTLNGIRIADNYETSLEPVGATDGYVISGGSLVWTVDALPPGKTVKRQIKCKCLQAVRSACNRVSVTAEGVSAVGDEACLEVSTGVGNNDDGDVPAIAPNPIRPDEPRFVPRGPTRGGIAPATGLTISIGEQTDPVRIGTETAYQVVISNKTDTSDKQVTVAVRIPDTMSMRGVEGPIRAKILERSAQFEPIAELRAGESITFQVRVRADKPGSGRFEVEATSQQQRTPVRVDEATQTVQ